MGAYSALDIVQGSATDSICVGAAQGTLYATLVKEHSSGENRGMVLSAGFASGGGGVGCYGVRVCVVRGRVELKGGQGEEKVGAATDGVTARCL